MVLTLGLAAYLAAAVPGPLRTTRGVLGLAAVALLLGGLVTRAPGALPWSIGLLAISTAVAVMADGISVERMVPLLGPGLLLAAELAWWALDRGHLPREPAGVARRRSLLLVTMAVAGAVLAVLVTLAGDLASAAAGLEVRVLGVSAAVVVAWVLAVLARRPGGR